MKIRFGIGCSLLVALLSAAPSRANVILTVGSVSAAPGSTGNSLDVTLTNTGVTALTVFTFNFTISTSNTDITFTSADTSTAVPYIFAGDSLFGPIISTSSPGQTLSASDAAASGGDSVAGGATVGLGHVFFDVLPTAALGSFDVVFSTDIAHTSLSNSAGGNIPINTFTSGSITIATPEPGTIAFLGSGLVAVILAKRRARRRAC